MIDAVKLLQLLESDCTLKNDQLAAMLGVTEAQVEEAIQKLREEHLPCRFFIGGVIPKADEAKLLEMGVANVFPVGTTFAAMNQWILEHYDG